MRSARPPHSQPSSSAHLRFAPIGHGCHIARLSFPSIIYSKIRKPSTKPENIDKTSGHQKQLKIRNPISRYAFLSRLGFLFSICHGLGCLLSSLLAWCTITVNGVLPGPLLLPLPPFFFAVPPGPLLLPVSLSSSIRPPRRSALLHPLLLTAAIPSSSISRVSVLLPILFPLCSPAGPPLQSASASPPTSIVPTIPGPILNSAPIYPCSHIPLFTYAYAS